MPARPLTFLYFDRLLHTEAAGSTPAAPTIFFSYIWNACFASEKVIPEHLLFRPRGALCQNLAELDRHL
jgi:hypothetical protein